MKLHNALFSSINRYYKIISVMAPFLVGSYFSVLHASDEATEVIYVKAANSSNLNGLSEDQIRTTTFYIQGKEDKIEFISEKTKFKFEGKEVTFKEEPSNFFDKIRQLYANVKEDKKHSKFNHLCLTLYIIYQKPDNLTVKLLESPLFARKSEKYILNEQGDLVVNPETKVIFYTKTESQDSDQWAYFTTFDGLTSKVKKKPGVFLISTDSYECDTKDCNVVCKKFFHAPDDECPSRNSHSCRDTEPHALYHVIKHSRDLFSPLIMKAGNVDNIKHVGLRFFSYYQACASCVQLLSKEQLIEISPNKSFKLNYIFYFYYMYGGPPVIKINANEITLSNNYNQYLFRGFLKNNIIYFDNPDEAEEPNKDGDVKGYFEFAKQKDLNTLNGKIISIYYTGLKRFRIYLL